MRKFIFTLFMLLACSSMAQAQLSPIQFGVKAGTNIVNVDINNVTASIFNADSNVGYHLGVMSRIDLGPLYVQPELLYNSNKVSYTLYGMEQEWRLNTIDVPVMLGISIAILRLGVGVNFTLFDNYDGHLLNDSSPLNKESISSYLFGAGISLLGLDIEARYIRSINSSTQNIYLDGESLAAQIKRGMCQISVGYMF